MDLTELTDRVMITETLHSYCRHVDDAEIDSLLRLFTPDAVVEMGNGVVITGRDHLRALFIDRIARWTTTNHHCSTTTLSRYDGATATAGSYIYAFHDSPERDRTMHLWGRYDDELIRTLGSWRISRRRLLVAGIREGDSQDLPARFERYHRTALPTPQAAGFPVA